MKVLVACEESQRTCIEFRKLGHEAYSCDIQECSGGHPEWHILGDVIPFLDEDWDLIIAHPPCTYLSNVGVQHLYKRDGNFNEERYKLGLEAKDFFMKFYNCKCKHVCIENSVATRIYNLPPYTQIIEPYYFGDPYQKKTCLWLKGLPKLKPTNICEQRESTRTVGGWYNHGGKDRQKNRSKTFPGIARAFAQQYGTIDLSKYENKIGKLF